MATPQNAPWAILQNWITFYAGPLVTNNNAAKGWYTYQIQFDLPQCDNMGDLAINGTFWADNYVNGLLLNNNALNVSYACLPHCYSGTGTSFSAPAGSTFFKQGVNTLTFIVWNEGGDTNDNWTGLAVNATLSGTCGAVCVPPGYGILKVCKAAGPGVAFGTKFTFAYSSTVASGTLTVPAGPAPGGNCVLGPAVPAGTVMTVVETNSSGTGIPVAGIVINGYPGGPPYQKAIYVNINTGVAEFPISGVTEVTYTDNAPFGFLEICKQPYQPDQAPALVGNFTFTVSPGNSGPIVVPAGACSPAIQVPVGNMTIQENPQTGSTLVTCSANPPSQQVGACNLTTRSLTVNVAQGAISTQTIATFYNQATPNTGGGGSTSNNQ